MAGHQRALVLHVKKGRTHLHIIWNRVDADTLTPINDKYVFNIYSKPTATQARAFELLGVTPDCTQ